MIVTLLVLLMYRGAPLRHPAKSNVPLAAGVPAPNAIHCCGTASTIGHVMPSLRLQAPSGKLKYTYCVHFVIVAAVEH